MAVTTKSMASIWPTVLRRRTPSESEIATPISITVITALACGPEQHGDPGVGVERGARRGHHVHDHRRERGRERELREVEDQLDRRQPALDRERGRGSEQRARARGRPRSRTAVRTRAGDRRARRSARCAGTAGGPRSSRPRGSRPPGPTTAGGGRSGPAGPGRPSRTARSPLRRSRGSSHHTGLTRANRPRSPPWDPSAPAPWGSMGASAGGGPPLAVRPIDIVNALNSALQAPTLDPRAATRRRGATSIGAAPTNKGVPEWPA